MKIGSDEITHLRHLINRQLKMMVFNLSFITYNFTLLEIFMIFTG